MKLTRLQYTSALLFVFGLITCAYCATDECHWSIMGPTSVTFDWRTEGDSSDDKTIYYGTTSGSLTDSLTASPASPTPDANGYYWECPLTSLSVDKLYYYKITGSGAEHTFRTPPTPGASGFTIVVTSDWQESGIPADHTQNCMNLIAAVAPPFVLVTGDLSRADESGESYEVHIRCNDMMVWSQDAAYIPCFGNHDWTTAEQFNWWLGRVAFPNAQDTPGPYANTPEDWCWFDYGNIRFVSYPEGWTGGWSSWNTNAHAVFSAAENDPNIKCIVVFGHRPAYSSGYHDNDGTHDMGPILNSYADQYTKFKLCFYGHNHLMEVSGPQGTHGVIYACADSPYPCQFYNVTPKPSYVNFRALHPGFIKATFYDNSIVLQYIAGDDDLNHFDVSEIPGTHNPGDIVYTYTIPCLIDNNAPAPDPMTWASAPVAETSTTVTMTADTATDVSGVEYFFHNVTDPNHDSGWQDSVIYTDTWLIPDVNYEYQVKARDKSDFYNETAYSETAIARTPACSSQSVLFSDDFEDYEEISTVWNVSSTRYVYITDEAAYTGTHSVIMKKASWIQKQISTAGYSNIHVQYARKVNGTDPYDAGEYLYAEWSVDGINWNTLEQTQQTRWACKDFVCDPNADNDPNFQVRFRTTANLSAEYVYVDSVKIYVTSMPGDINADGVVDFFDFAEFAAHWDETGCSEPDWCDGANLNKTNNYIDFADLNVLAEYWLEGL